MEDVPPLAPPPITIDSAVTETDPAAPVPNVLLVIVAPSTSERLPAWTVTAPAGPVDPRSAAEVIPVRSGRGPPPSIAILSAVTVIVPAAPLPSVSLVI